MQYNERTKRVQPDDMGQAGFQGSGQGRLRVALALWEPGTLLKACSCLSVGK